MRPDRGAGGASGPAAEASGGLEGQLDGVEPAIAGQAAAEGGIQAGRQGRRAPARRKGGARARRGPKIEKCRLVRPALSHVPGPHTCPTWT